MIFSCLRAKDHAFQKISQDLLVKRQHPINWWLESYTTRYNICLPLHAIGAIHISISSQIVCNIHPVCSLQICDIFLAICFISCRGTNMRFCIPIWLMVLNAVFSTEFSDHIGRSKVWSLSWNGTSCYILHNYSLTWTQPRELIMSRNWTPWQLFYHFYTAKTRVSEMNIYPVTPQT